MARSTTFEAAVVGLLAALASLCALHASGAETYSIVAQSTAATAATGRRPLSARIASGRLPLRPLSSAPAAAAPATAADTAASAREAVLQRVKQVLAARTPLSAASSTPADDDDRTAAAAEATVAEPAVTAGATAAEAPARLEFDVRESRVVLTEGERVIVNIAVRNIGSTPARRVETALYFADGVEPVKATGHEAAIASGEVRLEPIESLAPGDSVILAVTAVGVRPGSVIYRGELACAELPGVLAREGALRVDPRGDSEITGRAESGSTVRGRRP